MIYSSTLQIKDIAPYFLSVLAAFYAFTAVLYNRARAYPDGPTQRRSLLAAEEALRATMLYLVFLILGAVITYFLFATLEDTAPRKQFVPTDRRTLIVFLSYWIPIFFAALSYVSFAKAMQLVSVNFVLFRRVRESVRLMRKP